MPSSLYEIAIKRCPDCGEMAIDHNKLNYLSHGPINIAKNGELLGIRCQHESEGVFVLAEKYRIRCKELESALKDAQRAIQGLSTTIVTAYSAFNSTLSEGIANNGFLDVASRLGFKEYEAARKAQKSAGVASCL